MSISGILLKIEYFEDHMHLKDKKILCQLNFYLFKEICELDKGLHFEIVFFMESRHALSKISAK